MGGGAAERGSVDERDALLIGGRAQALNTDMNESWSQLAAFIEAGGHITIGRVAPIEGVAIAANDAQVFAVLKRGEQESLPALLGRLEAALMQATYSGEPVNEVGPEFVLERPGVRRRR